MVGAQGFEPCPGRLKVCCAKPLTLYPHMVHSLRFELRPRWLRVMYATIKRHEWLYVLNWFYVPTKTIRGILETLTFTWTFHATLLKKNKLPNKNILRHASPSACLGFLSSHAAAFTTVASRSMFMFGTRGRNRTYNNRVKVWCVTTTLLGNIRLTTEAVSLLNWYADF